ncbi:MAG: hypothetical protein Q8J78_03845 [Moraxellaceae bacterium]|nr:hypothetical protein [Moraxellaceae bacterium]
MNVAGNTTRTPELVYTPEGQPLRREDIKTLADQMRYELGRYRAWRGHSDPAFHDQFVTVQKWQVERLKRTHADFLVDDRYKAITQFFLSEIYGGLDLNELAREVERALPIATRLLPDSVMRTSAVALELNALTGELDEGMAAMLFETMGVTDITEAALIEAYRRCNNQEERYRQLDLLAELGAGLDRYVRSRVIYATFKIAHRPAQMAGLGGLYGFLGRGFEVMRPMGSAADFLSVFVGKERAIVDAIFDGKPDPFAT